MSRKSSSKPRTPRSLSLTVSEAATPVDLDVFLDAYARVLLAELQAGRPELSSLPKAA